MANEVCREGVLWARRAAAPERAIEWEPLLAHLGGRWWKCLACGHTLAAECECCEPPRCACAGTGYQPQEVARMVATIERRGRQRRR